MTGDRYGGEFPRELFRNHGISYELAQQTKSELFRDFLPLLNSVRVVLPRSDRLVSQVVALERRVSAGGKDTITHPLHGYDDLANAVAGAVRLSKYGGYINWRFDDACWDDTPPPPDPRTQAARVNKLVRLLKRGEPIPF